MLSAVISFVVPLVLSICFTFTFFVIVTTYSALASHNQSKVRKDNKTPFLRLNIAISTATPLPWVFGFIAILVRTSWAWYPFIVLISLQGFVIFIAFLFTKRTLNLYLGLFSCSKREKTVKHADKSSAGSTMQTLTCLLYTSPSPRDKRQSRMPSSA